ncbi:HEAT repeat protein-like protein [Dothidotthia symphoricarpi CBS 119687]|uniref:HEAT repeat protein-like protein n=1 Tax=Dothidotthia symphoricarpi CBS 119687 TaxID=1392245 RepID=A0A6A6A4L8_9PLEO|nr:HEAT repeat protein-like protein [Dothidotthia symphoricarpi CBS 119687]KAF2126115.1 HEAT repeat protein-like protein [Dothidotthia symphoricarpi CBS 119687]
MERQLAFQRLKQPCIQLLQVTATLAQRPTARKELVQALTHLLGTLRDITAKPGSVDAKLAEYAFVPVSQVLRVSRQVPVRALELCLECISTLLRTGWGGGLEPALSGQLLILFTFLAKPSSAENGIAATSEELQAMSFQCMAELLSETSRTSQGKQAITDTVNVPALGEAVLTMLDSLTESHSNSVKFKSVTALMALNDAIVDDDALASFLPKMVSSLTKVLTPSSSSRAGFRVIELSLHMMASLLSRLLSDRKTKDLPNEAPAQDSDQGINMSRSSAWLQATAAQIKIAMANVFKLRNHDKSEVRRALLALCLCVIQECRTSLSICTGMAVETVISLAGRDGSQDTVEKDLKALLASDQKLSDLLRESLHGWVVSLPRVMQSKDDHGRRHIIHQISVTIRLFEQNQAIIDDRLADSLRDGISIIFTDSRGVEDVTQSKSDAITEKSLVLTPAKSSSFPSLKLRLKGQEDMMAEFKLLVHELAGSDSALTVVQSLVGTLDIGSQEMQLGSFWISVNLLQDLTTTNLSFDDFIDMGTPSLREELLDDLYAHSVTILNQRDTETNLPWHFYALALETVALQARRYKAEFRAELSEILYPVLHYLGSSNIALRDHALTCLNILSEASGYSSASELVIENVDYIVNAVGLKLAMGDVSPQAPQVLLMMMRLCGPSLLPYLDDVVGSIFDALERYHGYPKLAELLFSVLKGMTEEGVKAPQLAIAAGDKVNQNRFNQNGVTIADVVETLKKMDVETRRREREDEEQSKTPFPEQPWKETFSIDSEENHDHDPTDEAEQPTDTPELPPPAPRTFEILLTISKLTQHYLTSTSSSLRNSLLSLLRTTIPALAKHENSFLPLINTLWPVLLPRLQDEEAYIVSNALEIVALMCEHAGDFMRSRIDDAWDILTKVHRRTKQRTDNRISSGKLISTSTNLSRVETGMSALSMDPISRSDSFRPEMYVDAPTRMIWNSLVGLLCAIAQHVVVRDERFDEILNVLDPVLDRIDVRQALEYSNADAVWLRLYKKSKQNFPQTSTKSINLAETSPSVGKLPVGRPHWDFVRL